MTSKGNIKDMYFLYFVKWAEFRMKIDEINKKNKKIKDLHYYY